MTETTDLATKSISQLAGAIEVGEVAPVEREWMPMTKNMRSL